MSRLDLRRLLPARLATRMTRYAVPLAILGVLLLVASGVAVAALVAPGGLGLTAARLSQTEALPDSLRTTGLAAADADSDGLSDALENYLYGTDAADWNSSGLGIPDGWLVEFGYDPLSPLVQDARGAAPPPTALPAAYVDGWPDAYRPTLLEYYRYGLPDDYRPGESAPWWRGAPHADPSKWDQSGTGIPTGWLVHYGVPIEGLEPDRVLPGSAGNLTVRDAFEHDTDPRAADSDEDGLLDWAEIHAHGTLPNRFSTAETGIADGWLVHYGLNAFDAAVAGQDPDRDGLTNLEEFQYSYFTLRDEIDRNGLAIVFTRGLNPLDWQTSKTGIPDGWYLRYDLPPFDTNPDEEVGRASDWPHFRAWVPDGLSAAEARAPDLAMNVREAYAYGRPADWNETINGVWWGGTNPATLDTDDDGLPDPVEILGWYANVTFSTGPEARPRLYLATSNPLEPDSDGDGLSDLEEYHGRTSCGVAGAPERSFPPTNPRAQDTAFSGLLDFEKVCGILIDDQRYDLLQGGDAGLDPTKADSAGDYIKDGPRVAFWHELYAGYVATGGVYPYEGSAYDRVFDWTRAYARFATLTTEEAVLAEFRVEGDVDGDGVPNVLDADPSGGLAVEKFGDPALDPPTKVYFLGGPEIDPLLYASTEFASPVPHVASDPANPDTDGDGLPDAWEIRYGTFDAAISAWNLDPSQRDSDGNGVDDGLDNNDGDEVTWYAYSQRGAGVDRTSHTFVFSNFLEFKADTDPNRLSTVGDGIPDGWKAFWGSRVSEETFLNLLAARDSRVGDVVLSRASELEGIVPQTSISPLANLHEKGDPRKVTGYVRIVANLSSCSSPSQPFATLLEQGEAFHGGSEAAACKANVIPIDGAETNFLLIEGSYALDYRREVDLRTNPYLVDSDGDGAPDAYEAYMADRQRDRSGGAGVQFPNPAMPDGARDADDDGIGLADECASADGGVQCSALPPTLRIQHPDGLSGRVLNAGADPNLVDTDGDGIQDGIEFEAGLNPLDPADVADFRDPDRDTDRDGVADYLELTGWGRTKFTVNVRTDPQDPDTDKDGLLDGENRFVDPAADRERAEALLARGIAHKRNPNGTYDFYGEDTLSTKGARPDVLDSADTGIPDGWRALCPDVNPEDGEIQRAYAAFRPSWWDEARHGVWWWGTIPPLCQPPSNVPDANDLDADGLNDLNGEDPFPAMSRENRVTWGNLTITQMRQLEAFVEAGATPMDVRHRAQAIGDGAGAPTEHRSANRLLVNPNGVLTREDGAKVAITDFRIVDGFTGGAGGVPRITKGIPFTFEGRVVLDERLPGGALTAGTEDARVGVANRTVLVSFHAADPTRVVGVGFTNETGWFEIQANITPQVSAEIPHAGIVAFGLTEGVATTSFDPSTVSAGATTAGQQNRLVAWVTNTSSTVAPGHPTHGNWSAWLRDAGGVPAERTTHATRFAASQPINVTVFSETAFTSTLAATAVNGETLVGDLVLLDASGGPIAAKPVRLAWTGTAAALNLPVQITDRSGKVNLTSLLIPASVRAPDQYALTARFESTDPNLNGTVGVFPVAIRSPTLLLATLASNATTVGDSLVVQGTLTTRDVVLNDGSRVPSVGVAGATVTARLGGVDVSTDTDERGRYSLRIQVPETLAAGGQNVIIRFEGTDTEAPAEALAPISVKRKASILDLNRIEGPRSSQIALTGRLVDNEGKGFRGTLSVVAATGRLASVESQGDGRFSVQVPMRLLDLGTQQVQVVFAGDAGHGSAVNTTIARVTTTTRLEILDAPREVVRGEAFSLRARLLDDAGEPVDAAAVRLLWRGEPAGTQVTDADGRVAFTVQTNLTERATTVPVAVRFEPAPSAVYRGSAAGSDVAVKAGSVLTLGNESVRRGPVRVTGMLLNDEGTPLAGSLVEVTLASLPPQQAVTSRNGSFELVRTLPSDFPLGPIEVVARYGGTGIVAGDVARATWLVRSPLTLDLAQLGPFVRGEAAPAKGRISDDLGQPVDLALNVTLNGVEIGVVRATAGAFESEVDVPANTSRGPARLVLSIPGSERYEPLERTYDIIVKIRPHVEVKLPALAVRGFSFSGEVQLLDDQGEPLRNTTFAYVVGADGSPVTGRTGSDGRAELALVAPITGSAVVGFTVRGGNDVVSASSTYSGVNVVGPATPIGYAGLILAILVVLGVAGAIVAAVYLRRRQLTEAREIIDEAIRDLLAGNEYAGVIFLAYRRFVAHLSRHGFTEKASDTPREFALGVRKALPVGAVPLRELIRLFEEARYSDHAIGSLERDRAVESLALVRAELDRLLGKKAAATLPGGAPA